MIAAKLQTELARKQLSMELTTRQTKRAQEIAAYEKKIKELSRLLDITVNGLNKAAQLMQVVSPEVAVNLRAVVKTVYEQRDVVLNSDK